MAKQESEIDMQVLNSYRMPRANPGMQVLWYRNGTRDRTRVEVAYMLHAGERTANIYALISGRRVEVVRHVDDPKLLLNADQRENGAWDFTDDFKEAQRERAELGDRISTLERQISKLITAQARIPDKPKQECRKTDPTASKLREFQELRQKAEAMGIPLTYRSTKAEIESAIKAKEEAAEAVS
jgi:hypothetical protein